MQLTTVAFLIAMSAANGSLADADAPGQQAPQADGSSQQDLGVASMEADGTIVLDLRTQTPAASSEGEIKYPPNHPRYEEILQHLGGLVPGQSKPIPPWR